VQSTKKHGSPARFALQLIMRMRHAAVLLGVATARLAPPSRRLASTAGSVHRGGFWGRKPPVEVLEPYDGDHVPLSRLELAAIIAADLAPHGMLPLAWAAQQGAGTGWLPAAALLAAFGSASAYSLYLAARLAPPAEEGGAPALSQVWKKVKLPGARGVDGLVAALCGGCCIFYAAFAADLFHSLAAAAGFDVRRAAVLVALAVAPLAPLCLADDLSALKYSSFAGLAGVGFTALFLLSAGRVPAEAAVPALRVTPGSLVLANTLVVAFLCHYNAVQYYRELRDPSPRRYAQAVGAGCAVTGLVFACTLFGGARAFGAAAQPNVLNNFGGGPGAACARLGTGVAILSGFPLMFAGLKAALAGAAPGWTGGAWWTGVQAALLGAIVAVASVATEDDVGLIIELLGSTLGVAAVYIIPGLCAAVAPRLEAKHRAAGAALAAVGSVIAVGGTTLTLKTHGAH